MIFRLRLASRAQLAVARISNRSSPEKMKITPMTGHSPVRTAEGPLLARSSKTNAESIDTAVDDMKDEIVEAAAKELKKAFKGWKIK